MMYPFTATIRRCTGAFNADGTPVYGASSTISHMWQEGTARVVTDGMEVTTAKTRQMFTPTALGSGDEVTYIGAVYHVAGITTVPLLDGTILYWEAVME